MYDHKIYGLKELGIYRDKCIKAENLNIGNFSIFSNMHSTNIVSQLFNDQTR